MELETGWIHLEPVPDRTLTLGDVAGECRPVECAMPVPAEGGLVLSLVALSAYRAPAGFGTEGAASVWEVLACEERARVVPGMRLFSHPSPPCGICPACRADAYALCPDSLRRPSGPGWFSRHRVLHPWSARRGAIVLPSDLDAGAASLLEPLAIVLRLERLFPRRDRVVVVGEGLVARLAGMALEGPRRRILLGADPDGSGAEHGFHAVCQDPTSARLALDGPADLVVLADGRPESVRAACALLAPGAALASFAAPEEAGELPARLHACGGTWRTVRGAGPDDWSLAARRLPALAARLADLPCVRLPLDRAGEAAALLASDSVLVRVELS